MRMLLRDTVRVGVRMLLRDTVLCEDVAARYRATDGADGAGVRMLLRTVRTVLV